MLLQLLWRRTRLFSEATSHNDKDDQVLCSRARTTQAQRLWRLEKRSTTIFTLHKDKEDQHDTIAAGQLRARSIYTSIAATCCRDRNPVRPAADRVHCHCTHMLLGRSGVSASGAFCVINCVMNGGNTAPSW